MSDASKYDMNAMVHNLTHRRFKNTSRESIYQQGSAVANSFYDPRNIGNFENGEISAEGTYATHYPVNAGSNTMGFTLMDDEGDDKRLYYPSTISSNVNALVKQKGVKGGAIGTTGSSGSSSDYMYFNPYYEALLNPKSHTTMEEVAQPHYLPHQYETGIKGNGTNAPSSASAVDFAMNNPYAFKSNFNGGALGASSSGSASDYYDSNPFRVPAMQSETRHFTDFMEGGAIDWAKYIGYIRNNINKIPDIIDNAPKHLETAAKTLNTIKELREILRGKPEKREKEIEYEEEPEEEYIKIKPTKRKHNKNKKSKGRKLRD